MMKTSRKPLSLLLALSLMLGLLALPALAAEEPTYNVPHARTTGGVLNIWAGPVKARGTSLGVIPNGNQISLWGGREWSAADNTWMLEAEYDGILGFVDARYVGYRTVPQSEYQEGGEPLDTFEGVAATTGGNLNIWATPNFTGRLITVKNGSYLGVVVTIAERPFAMVYDEAGVLLGYVRARYVKPAE